MSDTHLTEVFSLFTDWATANGVKDVQALPGCWSGKIGGFDLKLNGHAAEVESVPPYSLGVWRNGWPLGSVGPFDGLLMAGTEADLIADLKAALGIQSILGDK